MYKKLQMGSLKNVNVQKLSRIFQPSLIAPKDSLPKIKDTEIHSKSAKLMLELGLMRQSSPGCFTLLPLGVRALEKLTTLVDKEMQAIGGQKVEFPTLINERLWKISGRIKEVNELFKLKDRHEHSYLLGPTHEEVVSEMLSNSQNSYKQFPLLIYQITQKFRDELKPRLGLMRSRQFLMKDMYSFDIDHENAMETYQAVTDSYDRFFKNLEVDFHKVKGDTGIMGGSLSHEYHYTADVGEDIILECLSCNASYNAELVNRNKCLNCGELVNLKKSKGIEVGHTFLLGDKYSRPFNANYTNRNGKSTNLQMGCYGIGLTRTLAASIEKLSTDQEIRWPRKIAPYSILIIPPKAGSREESIASDLIDPLHEAFNNIELLKDDVILDDRTDLTIGKRNIQAKKFGYPIIIVLGNRIRESPVLYELHDVNGGVQIDLNFEDLLKYVNKFFSE